MTGMEVTFELLTPAFAGNADPKGEPGTDGLRPPTLKALLRFWWRALRPDLTPAELFVREEELFGSTRAGQGLRVVPDHDPAPSGNQIAPRGQYEGYGGSGDPWRAYAAFGPVQREEPKADPVTGAPPPGAVWDKRSGRYKSRNQTQVARLEPEYQACFRLELPRRAWDSGKPQAGGRWPHRPAKEPDRDRWRWQLEGALWLMAVAGGVGSRSRRGNGSLAVGYEEPGWQLMPPLKAERPEQVSEVLRLGLRRAARLHCLSRALETSEEWVPTPSEAQEWLDRRADPWRAEPQHSALYRPPRGNSQGFRLLWNSAQDGGFYAAADEAHRQAVLALYDFRRSLGWYRSGDERRTANPEGEDHQWRRWLCSLRSREEGGDSPLEAPGATCFGLPLMGHMSSGESVDTVLQGQGADRRASPLFVSVTHWGDDRFLPVLFYLPGPFLPAGSSVEPLDGLPPEDTPRGSNPSIYVEVLDRKKDVGQSRQDQIRWSAALRYRGDEPLHRFLDELLVRSRAAACSPKAEEAQP